MLPEVYPAKGAADVAQIAHLTYLRPTLPPHEGGRTRTHNCSASVRGLQT